MSRQGVKGGTRNESMRTMIKSVHVSEVTQPDELDEGKAVASYGNLLPVAAVDFGDARYPRHQYAIATYVAQFECLDGDPQRSGETERTRLTRRWAEGLRSCLLKDSLIRGLTRVLQKSSIRTVSDKTNISEHERSVLTNRR